MRATEISAHSFAWLLPRTNGGRFGHQDNYPVSIEAASFGFPCNAGHIGHVIVEPDEVKKLCPIVNISTDIRYPVLGA